MKMWQYLNWAFEAAMTTFELFNKVPYRGKTFISRVSSLVESLMAA
ncbi:hypothetical protein [Brasilonema sp. UFV-L1]